MTRPSDHVGYHDSTALPSPSTPRVQTSYPTTFSWIFRGVLNVVQTNALSLLAPLPTRLLSTTINQSLRLPKSNDPGLESSAGKATLKNPTISTCRGITKAKYV